MRFFKDIYALFYPNVCLCCNNQLTINELYVCLSCRHELPLTNFTNEQNNIVEQTFFGRFPIEQATALFYFHKKGNIQTLIHNLKYKNKQQVGVFIGNWLSEDLKESNRFKNIDFIVPVPLHKRKLKSRGYNQLTTFGKTLSENLEIPCITRKLNRVSQTNTQTKKLRLDRWRNVNELFFVQNPEYFNNKHILLIDDIITTGATLEACCKAFSKSKNIKISVACMAYTK